jgi:hypothetical protein
VLQNPPCVVVRFRRRATPWTSVTLSGSADGEKDSRETKLKRLSQDNGPYSGATQEKKATGGRCTVELLFRNQVTVTDGLQEKIQSGPLLLFVLTVRKGIARATRRHPRRGGQGYVPSSGRSDLENQPLWHMPHMNAKRRW